MIGWARPRQVIKIVNWCGHAQELVARPEADGDWGLVPAMGVSRVINQSSGIGPSCLRIYQQPATRIP
jgi:hypothetical protein